MANQRTGTGASRSDRIAPTPSWNPTEEDYWRESFTDRSYARGASFDDYSPAYRFGTENYSRFDGASFDEVEDDLSREWEAAKGKSKLAWDKAKLAVKDAWQRTSDAIERATPGDSDRDSK